MSTRCIYEIVDPHGAPTVYLYQHYDGYPEGAHAAVLKALPLAWELPRFDSDEFGAAIIAANKTGPGNYRLLCRATDRPGDVEYWHVVTLHKGGVLVTSHETTGSTTRKGRVVAVNGTQVQA